MKGCALSTGQPLRFSQPRTSFVRVTYHQLFTVDIEQHITSNYRGDNRQFDGVPFYFLFPIYGYPKFILGYP